MWESEKNLNILYRSSSFLSMTLQREIDLLYAQYEIFLKKHSLEFVDCSHAPIVEEELFDNLPSEALITTILKKPMSSKITRTIENLTIRSCVQHIEDSIRYDVEKMYDILRNIEDYIVPDNRESIRMYWFSDVRPNLDQNGTVVVLSLLLLCNHEHLIKAKKSLLIVLEKTSQTESGDEYLNSVLELTKKITSN